MYMKIELYISRSYVICFCFFKLNLNIQAEMPRLKNCRACDISYGSRGRSRTFKMTRGGGVEQAL